MSKFERVLSEDWLPNEFTSGNEIPVFSKMVDRKSLRSIIEQVEQAVLAKLAEQDPVMYARTYYGKIDWDEACVTEKNDGMLMHATDMREEDFIKHGYAVIPLYAHPMPSLQQEPVFYISDKVLNNKTGKIDSTVKNALTWSRNKCQSWPVPLYTHPIPCVSSMSDKTACVSEKAESDTQPDHVTEAKKTVVPEGYALVPVEPNEDMYKKIRKTNDIYEDDFYRLYADTLKAAQGDK